MVWAMEVTPILRYCNCCLTRTLRPQCNLQQNPGATFCQSRCNTVSQNVLNLARKSFSNLCGVISLHCKLYWNFIQPKDCTDDQKISNGQRCSLKLMASYEGEFLVFIWYVANCMTEINWASYNSAACNQTTLFFVKLADKSIHKFNTWSWL